MWFKKRSENEDSDCPPNYNLRNELIEVDRNILEFIGFLYKYPTLQFEGHYNELGNYEVRVMLGDVTVADLYGYGYEASSGYGYRPNRDFEPDGDRFFDKNEKYNELEESIKKYSAYIYRYMG